MRTAEELIEFTSVPVRQIFESVGFFRPLIHFINRDDEDYIFTCPPALSKANWVEFVRMVLEGEQAVTCVMINEAWMIQPKNTTREEIDRLIENGISNASDRVECIAFFGEDASGSVAGMMPIIRDQDKPRLGELKIIPRGDITEGIMIGLLPILHPHQVN